MGSLESEEFEFEPDEDWLDAVRRGSNLLELGFSPDQIDRMRVERKWPDFDWHEAKRLLEDGFTHEQVTFKLEPV
jgi:hypothetical protein